MSFSLFIFPDICAFIIMPYIKFCKTFPAIYYIIMAYGRLLPYTIIITIKPGGAAMLILGLNKTTLLDYPGHVAAALFAGGCNFRCPYCHNKDIVEQSGRIVPLTDREIFSFLEKRKNVLTGICITGGEPTLYRDLPEFIGRIKELGYLVKLDTNGTNPAMLKALIDGGLIDYCAMDVKNSPRKYDITVGFSGCGGTNGVQLAAVNDSIHILLQQDKISYEFRTTVVKELHEEADMISISKWIAGAGAYFIQSYVESSGVLCPGFHAHTRDTLLSYAALCRNLVPSAALRGVDI